MGFGVGALVLLGAFVHLGALVVLGALLLGDLVAPLGDGLFDVLGALVLGTLVALGALVSSQLSTGVLKLLVIALLRATATDVPETNNTAATVKEKIRILLRFLA